MERQAQRGSTSELDGDTLQLSGIVNGAFFADRYRIDALLGTGAMGKVFRATDLTNESPVALKVLHPDKARKDTVLGRFRREAQILAEIGHPGIVRVLDWGRAPDGVDYIAMEILHGLTLRERLQARGPMAPRELVQLVVAVADALGAAHVKGIVHRDLKPDNVMVIDGGGVKVLDFGLSLLDTDNRMTKTGVMLGTPRYMAPEQIRSAKDVDPRVDVYALGVMAHEALTNESPFPAQDAGQLLGCIMEGRIKKLEEQRPDLPPGFGDVVRRAMAKDRRNRYATIGGFAEALARAVGVTTQRARQPGVLEESAPDLAAPAEPVSIPAAQDRPRFTRPPDAPGAMGSSPKKASRAPLFVGLFVIALLVVTCIAAALAIGARELSAVPRPITSLVA